MTHVIAVVEDDLPFVEMITDALESEGYSVLHCTDGGTAVQVIRDAHPDLIILDIWLESPTTGWAIFDQLQADSTTRDIPVIVSSATAIPDDRKDLETVTKGHVRFLPRPFNLEDLYRQMNDLLRQPS